MSRSKSIAAQSNSGLRIAWSTQTRLILEENSRRLYEHNISRMFGKYVVLQLEDGRPISNWEAFDNYDDAYAALVSQRELG